MSLKPIQQMNGAFDASPKQERVRELEAQYVYSDEFGPRALEMAFRRAHTSGTNANHNEGAQRAYQAIVEKRKALKAELKSLGKEVD